MPRCGTNRSLICPPITDAWHRRCRSGRIVTRCTPTLTCRCPGLPGWSQSSWTASICMTSPSPAMTPAGQVQAFRRGAALDVGQQDRGIPGPVDVGGDQVIYAVGDDAGVDAEQQPVGDYHVQRREQGRADFLETAPPADRPRRAACQLPDLLWPGRAGPGQQPGDVLPDRKGVV